MTFINSCLNILTEEIAMRKDPHARLKTVSAETKDILQELEKEYKAPEKAEVKKEAINFLPHCCTVHIFYSVKYLNGKECLILYLIIC